MRIFILIAVWVLICLATPRAEALTDERSFASASVCKLNKDAEYFNNRKVRVVAIYITDLFHGGVLKDGKCPSAHIVIKFAKYTGAGEKTFDAIIMKDIMEVKLRQFVIDISGTFYKQKGTIRGHPSDLIVVDKLCGIRKLQGNWKIKRLKSEHRRCGGL